MPAFPSTRWSRILAPGGTRDLDALARAYQQPIRAYLAARLRCRADDVEDVAQEAFAWMLAKGLLDKADPSRGRFRCFLQRVLANFAIEQVRKANARRRGGGVAHTSIDADAYVDPAAATPEQILDDAWRRALLQRAHEQLQSELEAAGRATHWALFRAWFLAEEDVPDHATLAARHGISRTDVSNWLDHAKRRYRAILRRLVADTVGSEADLRDELRWLFGNGGGTA